MNSISAVSGGVDLQDVLINQATNVKSSQVKLAIGSAIMKQTMDQTEQMGDAIVEMIKDSPTAANTGNHVDIKV